MSRVPLDVLRRYLLAGQLSRRGCLRHPISLQRTTPCFRLPSIRYQSTNESPVNTPPNEAVSYRREILRNEKRYEALLTLHEIRNEEKIAEENCLKEWELTIGIEIHAQLNTPRKLFSSAASTVEEEPNSHVALFDLAMPGTQPNFQKETLIPAIRAALALNCDVQRTSTFDRKHYFHWDQPNGYQITQYYHPFAKDGYITLYKHDGIAEEDGDEIKIGIKQIQMEQDTAKTLAQPDNVHLIDFNRVGIPLIEIITLPQIHHPATAAALVRKIQIILKSVDACVLGMESGGLRADINVSVRRRNPLPGSETVAVNSYAGITNLGQRTEIKNLSSFKAVEAAIIAERNRQISVIEAGGTVESETRGWSLGSTETRRLRGKEGEVDYRYMPDADLPPLRIGGDLISHLRKTLGVLPDEELELLTQKYGLTMKDALSLVALEDGERADYFYDTVEELAKLDGTTTGEDSEKADIPSPEQKWGRITGNWVLHEIGGLLSTSLSLEPLTPTPSNPSSIIPIRPSSLAQILRHLGSNRITGKTAKHILSQIFNDPDESSVDEIIEKEGGWYQPITDEEYVMFAKQVIGTESQAWELIVVKGREGKMDGKIMFLVGKMIRLGKWAEGKDVDGKVAADVLRGLAVEERERRERGEEGGEGSAVDGQKRGEEEPK